MSLLKCGVDNLPDPCHPSIACAAKDSRKGRVEVGLSEPGCRERRKPQAHISEQSRAIAKFPTALALESDAKLALALRSPHQPQELLGVRVHPERLRRDLETRLADALAEMVEPTQARALLRYWVEHRDHHSEDIHVAKDEVLAFADRLIDDAFEGLGVPTRIWSLAAADVKKPRQIRGSVRQVTW